MSTNNKLFDGIQNGSISEIIIQRITDALINGDLKPGDKIPTEAEFSKNLNVSRNVVREAIKVLVAFGVLEIRRSEGTFVVENYNAKLLNPLIYGLILSNRTLEELLDFKIALQHSLFAMVMDKATDEELDHLEALGKQFQLVMSISSFDANNKYAICAEYNNYFCNLAHNQMMIQLCKMLGEIAAFTRFRCIETSVKNQRANLLPDSYMESIEILRSRDKTKIPAFLEKRLEIWRSLLLTDNE